MGRVQRAERLCWNLSKANNHSGAGEEYYIRVGKSISHYFEYGGVYTRLIKLIIFDATMAVSFCELPSAATTVQLRVPVCLCVCVCVCGGGWLNKKINGYLFDKKNLSGN